MSAEPMLHFPRRNVSLDASRNLDRFRNTSLARELENDSRRWDVVEWSWAEGPPLRVQVRSDRGDVIEFVMDEPGIWRAHPDPNVPHEPLG
jgi:hypothetical protein